MGVLTIARTVMHYKGGAEGVGASFVDEVFPRQVDVPWEQYEDMGRPDAITVTIEPGDRLN